MTQSNTYKTCNQLTPLWLEPSTFTIILIFKHRNLSMLVKFFNIKGQKTAESILKQFLELAKFSHRSNIK